MADDDLDAFNARLGRLAGEFIGIDLRRRMIAVGKGGVDDAAEAVRSDLGDLSMSNWWTRKPIDITARFVPISDHEVEVSPEKRNRGPWRVLEEGRNAGDKALGPIQGPIAPKLTKSGKLSKRQPRRRKWSGTTSGKQTWSDAVALMDRRTLGRVHGDIVLEALKQHFR